MITNERTARLEQNKLNNEKVVNNRTFTCYSHSLRCNDNSSKINNKKLVKGDFFVSAASTFSRTRHISDNMTQAAMGSLTKAKQRRRHNMLHLELVRFDGSTMCVKNFLGTSPHLTRLHHNWIFLWWHKVDEMEAKISETAAFLGKKFCWTEL